MYSFTDADLRLIQGTGFSSGADVRFVGRSENAPDRLDLLSDLCRGKRVIHVGCADHAEHLERKYHADVWLHGRLLKTAARCVGFDINATAVDLVRKLGVKDVYCTDILSEPLPAELTNETWDLLVLGEVLEHIDSPIEFLKRLKERLGGRVHQMVVTVPNAFCLHNFVRGLGATESINTDHRFWFSPFTLAKVLAQAGLQPGAFDFVEPFSPGKREFLSPRFWVRRSVPAFRESVVMFATFS